MTVIHQFWNVSTSRLYGSLVGPPEMLTLPIVKFSRCQTRNSRIVMPPQRIQREENDDARFFFITYLVVRALCARRHSVTAQYTWTTSATISTMRSSHSRFPCGSTGSPNVRRCAAYSL